MPGAFFGKPHIYEDESRIGLCQLGIHRDGGVQDFGHWAASLGFAGEILESGVINTGDRRRHVEMTGRDGKPAVFGLEGDCGGGFNLIRSKSGHAEDHREGHREAARVRGADEFLRICALFTFETGFKGVRFGDERAGARSESSGTFLEAALPDCGCFLFHNRQYELSQRSVKWLFCNKSAASMPREREPCLSETQPENECSTFCTPWTEGTEEFVKKNLNKIASVLGARAIQLLEQGLLHWFRKDRNWLPEGKKQWRGLARFRFLNCLQVTSDFRRKIVFIAYGFHKRYQQRDDSLNVVEVRHFYDAVHVS